MVTFQIENNKLKGIELVCIDKDGTVLTYDMYFPVMKKRAEELVKRYNLEKETKKEILEIMGLDSNEQIIMGGRIHMPRLENIRATIEFLRKNSVNASFKEISELFNEIDESVDLSKHTKVYPGIELFLKTLKEKGIKIVMTTFDSTDAAKRHLKNSKLLDYFDLVLGIDEDSPYNPKPAPDMLQYSCKLLEVDPHKSIVIGDDNNDMLLAKNAGALAAIGVLTGRSSKEDLKNADFIINSIDAIKIK
ncbi:MAG: HAD family hydrolase [Candidatus Heimdallarchaeum endolithica]|uniref:HAD family hydrolase n=1 Tax=Candidatus Heimdallarchaeum endolithica TaxID=2876572 RepID=A0A9Y1BRR2_9ARCH|nr:MAG: HAD family hydrolase [Candidatus Heimdallarchaeum endolithica]